MGPDEPHFPTEAEAEAAFAHLYIDFAMEGDGLLRGPAASRYDFLSKDRAYRWVKVRGVELLEGDLILLPKIKAAYRLEETPSWSGDRRGQVPVARLMGTDRRSLCFREDQTYRIKRKRQVAELENDLSNLEYARELAQAKSSYQLTHWPQRVRPTTWEVGQEGHDPLRGHFRVAEVYPNNELVLEYAEGTFHWVNGDLLPQPEGQ